MILESGIYHDMVDKYNIRMYSCIFLLSIYQGWCGIVTVEMRQTDIHKLFQTMSVRRKPYVCPSSISLTSLDK